MKFRQLILLFSFIMIAYSCSKEQIIADEIEAKNVPTSNGFATTTFTIDENIKANIDQQAVVGTKRLDEPTTPQTRAGSQGPIKSAGYIVLQNPDRIGSTFTIDMGQSNFQTWIFICNPARSKMGYALLDWDNKTLSADGKRINLSVDTKDITFTWLGVPDNEVVGYQDGDKWFVCAVLGGGTLTPNMGSRDYRDIENGFISSKTAYELSFREMPKARGHIEVPYASNWQPLTIKSGGSHPKMTFSLNLSMRGNLIRTAIEEDNNITDLSLADDPEASDIAKQFGNNGGYNWNTNLAYYKTYHLQSTTFYQPLFLFSYQMRENNDLSSMPITTGVPETETAKGSETTQVLVPGHERQDMSTTKGQHLFVTWGVPNKLAGAPLTSNDDFYTRVVSSNGGCVLGSKINNYVGEATFKSKPRKEGSMYNLGQLKEVTPAITQEQAAAAGLGDAAVMEYPVPLAALAEYNLGTRKKMFARDNKKLSEQGAWTRDRIIETDLIASGETTYNKAMRMVTPEGYRLPTLGDMGLAFPYVASNSSSNPNIRALNESSELKFLEFRDNGNDRGYYTSKYGDNNIPEYLNRQYSFGITVNTDKPDVSHLTKNRYWVDYEYDKREGMNNALRLKMYGIRHMPQDNESEKVRRLNEDKTKIILGNSHKCAYRFDFTHMDGVKYTQVQSGLAESYVVIRARYIGNAPVTEEMVRSEKWWSKKMPGETERIFTMAGLGVNMPQDKATTNFSFNWDQNGWLDSENGTYLTNWRYDGGTWNATIREIFRNHLNRRSRPSYWAFQVRPVRDYYRL